MPRIPPSTIHAYNVYNCQSIHQSIKAIICCFILIDIHLHTSECATPRFHVLISIYRRPTQDPDEGTPGHEGVGSAFIPGDLDCTTRPPTTIAPTTLAPTQTLAPVSRAPTTFAPTTLAPTTLRPTTIAPTTKAPTTIAPTSVCQLVDTMTSPKCCFARLSVLIVIPTWVIQQSIFFMFFCHLHLPLLLISHAHLLAIVRVHLHSLRPRLRLRPRCLPPPLLRLR